MTVASTQRRLPALPQSTTLESLQILTA